MSRPRRAFSALLRPGEPFDWPLFLRGLPFQPAVIWFALSALTSPFARAFPVLSRAVCVGRPRQGIVDSATVVYTLFVPAAGAALIYLLVGRRKLTHPHHRRIGDVMLALILALTAADAFVMIRNIHEQWESMRPGLESLRKLCWP